MGKPNLKLSDAPPFLISAVNFTACIGELSPISFAQTCMCSNYNMKPFKAMSILIRYLACSGECTVGSALSPRGRARVFHCWCFISFFASRLSVCQLTRAGLAASWISSAVNFCLQKPQRAPVNQPISIVTSQPVRREFLKRESHVTDSPDRSIGPGPGADSAFTSQPRF